MIWQEPYADLARDRQREMLEHADLHRLARAALTGTSRYREWLARQLVILALRLAPSLRVSSRGLLADDAGPATLPGAGSRSLEPLA